MPPLQLADRPPLYFGCHEYRKRKYCWRDVYWCSLPIHYDSWWKNHRDRRYERKTRFIHFTHRFRDEILQGVTDDNDDDDDDEDDASWNATATNESYGKRICITCTNTYMYRNRYIGHRSSIRNLSKLTHKKPCQNKHPVVWLINFYRAQKRG